MTLSEYYSRKSFINLFKKIILPFIGVEAAILLIYAFCGNFNELPMSYKALGAGPGAYYPFIYVQIWLIAPLFFYCCKNLTIKNGWGILLIIMLLTMATYFFIKEDFIYKRFIIRYAFLGVLVWLWYINKVNIKMVNSFCFG